MTERTMIDMDAALADVSKAFGRPGDIVEAKELTHEQQVKLLKHWETDLRQLMVASDENMPSTAPGDVAAKLQEVRRCLGVLHADDGAEQGAPNQAGGCST